MPAYAFHDNTAYIALLQLKGYIHTQMRNHGLLPHFTGHDDSHQGMMTQAFPFRITSHPGLEGRPTVEGVHQDGTEITMTMLNGFSNIDWDHKDSRGLKDCAVSRIHSMDQELNIQPFLAHHLADDVLSAMRPSDVPGKLGQTMSAEGQALFDRLSPDVQATWGKLDATLHLDEKEFNSLSEADRKHFVVKTTAKKHELAMLQVRNPFDCLLFRDRVIKHSVTTVNAKDLSLPAVRDMWIIVTRRPGYEHEVYNETTGELVECGTFADMEQALLDPANAVRADPTYIDSMQKHPDRNFYLMAKQIGYNRFSGANDPNVARGKTPKTDKIDNSLTEKIDAVLSLLGGAVGDTPLRVFDGTTASGGQFASADDLYFYKLENGQFAS